MKSCITCGMPLEGVHVNDIGLELADGSVCRFDSENGKLKSGEEILEGGVNFFIGAVADGKREFAERITRKNMKSLPYWQARPFNKLEGAEATDDEFQSAMAKLSFFLWILRKEIPCRRGGVFC